MKLQVADRMKDYEEGIFQILNEKKEEVEKKGKKLGGRKGRERKKGGEELRYKQLKQIYNGC